jgi:hypothetical protein
MNGCVASIEAKPEGERYRGGGDSQAGVHLRERLEARAGTTPTDTKDPARGQVERASRGADVRSVCDRENSPHRTISRSRLSR